MTQELIEKKVRELYRIYNKESDFSILEGRKIWKQLAKSVLLSELRARLDEVEMVHRFGMSKRITELTEEIKTIERVGE